jgi:hypothetical protein
MDDKNEPWRDLESYMEKTYWVVDILPKQVPENSRGQYFKIEEYYLCHPQVDVIYKKFSDIFLKLNCYDDIAVSQDGENWVVNPAPRDLVDMVTNAMPPQSMFYAFLKSADTLIVATGYDTYFTIYNPTTEILELLRSLASAEGLFLWKP